MPKAWSSRQSEVHGSEAKHGAESTKYWDRDDMRANIALGPHEIPGSEGNYVAKLKYTKENINNVPGSNNIKPMDRQEGRPVIAKYREYGSKQADRHLLIDKFQVDRPADSHDFCSSHALSHSKAAAHGEDASDIDRKDINIPAEAQDDQVNSKQYFAIGRNDSKAQREPSMDVSERYHSNPCHTTDERHSSKARFYTNSTGLVDRETRTLRVKSGLSVPYAHKVATPQYMDTFEKPYARFVFHYRSQGKFMPRVPRLLSQTLFRSPGKP